MGALRVRTPPSALPGISPTGGESDSRQSPRPKHDSNAEQRFLNVGDERTPSTLPPCGGDARQGGGGYPFRPEARIPAGKRLQWR